MKRAYEAVVVGAGTAGCVVARRLADAGRSVALIETGGGAPLAPEPVDYRRAG